MTNKIMLEMIRYFGADARRINHALKVYSFSHLISEMENLPEEKKIIVLCSALLHDIGIKEAERKYNSSSGEYQEVEGPPIARTILSKLAAPKLIIDRVCFIIANHHTYSKIDDADFQILVEADFLVNIFEDNLSADSVVHINKNLFKTKSGTAILSSMYYRTPYE